MKARTVNRIVRRPARTIRSFRRSVLRFFKFEKRDFPWRHTRDPYQILVSEVMLQQTQADRAVPYFRSFLKRFPTASALARAPQRSVVALWQGLGYNRRALMLHRAAKEIGCRFDGTVPRSREALESLPGVGPYTAAAVRTFAFNEPEVFIETNVRSVFIHSFFPRARRVADARLTPLIEQTLDRRNPRRWYSALMDYGAMLKRRGENPSRRSAHRTSQAPFRGSRRELRGALIRFALNRRSFTAVSAARALKTNTRATRACLGSLVRERFLTEQGGKFSLR